MPFDQKNVLNKSKKKIDKKRFTGKNVRVTKHFQPELIYRNKNFLQRDFPEINSDVDIVESLSSIKTPNMKLQPSKNSLYGASSTAKTHISKNIKPNSLHQNILSPIPTFQRHGLKSISCIEDRPSLYREIYKSLKSKSFVEAGSQSHKILHFKSDAKSINSEDVTIPSNIRIEENVLDRLKKEIIINRIEGFRSFSTCSERKEKMEKIRRELSLLVHPPKVDQKITENEERPFAEASKPVLIYNVNETKNSSLNSDRVRPTVLKKQKVQKESQRLEDKESQSK